MTPWRSRDLREYEEAEAACDALMEPVDFEAWELSSEFEHATERGQMLEQADRALITGFLTGKLSRADTRWVEYRLGSNPEFRDRAEPFIRKWGASLGFAPDADLAELIDRVGAEHGWKLTGKEDALDPSMCMLRLGIAWGSEYAEELVESIGDFVEENGNADRWIAYVKRMKDSGAMNPEAARLLILRLALAATKELVRNDPLLRGLDAEMKGIERENGLEEDEQWEPRWAFRERTGGQT